QRYNAQKTETPIFQTEKRAHPKLIHDTTNEKKDANYSAHINKPKTHQKHKRTINNRRAQHR
ncbi:hypothetical protein ACJBSQ_10435, partial [Streptococcus suis]